MTELAERLDEYTDDLIDAAPPGQVDNCIAVVCPDFAAEAGYFAAGLARRLVEREPFETPPRDEAAVVLVDGLPGTGGLDVVADLEAAPGARWGALRGARGEIDVSKLLRALPQREGVAVLSHDRAQDLVAPPVRGHTIEALSNSVGWVVGTQPPERLPDEAFSVVVLLVRGTVSGLAAAQKYVGQLGEETPVAVVCLETPATTRALVADSLSRSLVGAAATRWKLASAASAEVVTGAWPGSKDRTLSKLLDDVVVYICSRGRSLAWA